MIVWSRPKHFLNNINFYKIILFYVHKNIFLWVIYLLAKYIL